MPLPSPVKFISSQFDTGQRLLVTLALGEGRGLGKLVRLDQRTELDVEHRRMDADAGPRGLGQLFVLGPS